MMVAIFGWVLLAFVLGTFLGAIAWRHFKIGPVNATPMQIAAFALYFLLLAAVELTVVVTVIRSDQFTWGRLDE